MLRGMDDVRLGRAIRVLRQRRGWRQEDLGARCGLGRSAISDIERGHAGRYTLATLRTLTRSLGADASVFVRWGGPGDLDRLLDRDHAALVELWAEMHRRGGWEVWPEASFSVFGERGRIDLLAFHPATGVLEVTEVKTGVWDVQDTLGRLDVKIRLAPRLAAERGWRARRVIGALVIGEGRTARRRIEQHATLFSGFDVRGHAARGFVLAPTTENGRGLLVFLPVPDSNMDGARRGGQRRVRPRRP